MIGTSQFIDIPLASPYSLMPDPSTTAKIDPVHLITRLGEDTPTRQDDRLCHLHWAFRVPQYINPSRKTIQKK